MSSHADTILRVLNWPMAYFSVQESEEAHAALDALVAENQRLRDALEADRLVFAFIAQEAKYGKLEVEQGVKNAPIPRMKLMPVKIPDPEGTAKRMEDAIREAVRIVLGPADGMPSEDTE